MSCVTRRQHEQGWQVRGNEPADNDRRQPRYASAPVAIARGTKPRFATVITTGHCRIIVPSSQSSIEQQQDERETSTSAISLAEHRLSKCPLQSRYYPARRHSPRDPALRIGNDSNDPLDRIRPHLIHAALPALNKGFGIEADLSCHAAASLDRP
jgi:hypothetical protein